MKKMFGLLLGVMLLAGCATTQTPQSGFLGEYYSNLGPGPEGGAKMRWLKPGVDFGKYNKFMVDSVVFALAADSENKTIDPEAMKDLQEKCNLALVNAIKDKYPVVAEPGPDVVRIRTAITGLKQSSPVLSGVTTILPIGLGISLIKKGATGAYTGSGATNAEMMVLDSTSNEVIAVGQDELTAAFWERFSKWGSAEESFKVWGERLVKFMDSTKAK